MAEPRIQYPAIFLGIGLFNFTVINPYAYVPLLGPRVYIFTPFIYICIAALTIHIFSLKRRASDQAISFKYQDKEVRLNATAILRPLAAFLVFYTHARLIFGVAPSKSNAFLTILFYFPAWLGMGIFFTLSGYLISNLFLTRRYLLDERGIKYFYLHRLKRIVPLVIVVSILFLILNFKKSDITVSYLYQLFLFNYNGSNGIEQTKVQWSLTTELQFYLIFPILFLLIRKIQNRNHILLSIVGILFCACLIRFLIFLFLGFDISKWSNNIYQPLLGNIDYFLIGAVAPFISHSVVKGTTLRILRISIIPSFFVMYVAYSLLTYTSMDAGRVDLQKYFVIFGPTIVSVFMIPILIGLASIDLTKFPQLLKKIIIELANATYPFYLLHIGILLFVHSIDLHFSFLSNLIIALFITGILSVFLSALVHQLYGKLAALASRFSTRFLG
jgi:peptidoglycan/LPS O-acetylase OafA/YrhL